MKKRIMSLALVFTICLSLVMSANAVSEEVTSQTDDSEIYISAECLENASIKIEADDLISITYSEPVEENGIAAAGTFSVTGEELRATDVNTIALLMENPEDTQSVYADLLAAGDEADSYKTKSDAIVGIKIHTRVYYTVVSESGEEWYRLVKVTGGNDKSNASNVIGSGYVISSQSVTYGVWGPNLEGLPYGIREWSSTRNLSKTADSFSYNVESLHPSWPTVLDRQSLLGCTYTMHIHSARDGSDRTIELVNNPLDNFDLAP